MTGLISISVNDLLKRWLQSQMSVAVYTGATDPVAGNGLVIQPQANDAYITGTPYGVTTAPTAGLAIATLTAPPIGLYTVRVVTRITTAAVASLADNISIRVGGTEIRRILHPAVATTTTQLNFDYVQDFRLPGGSGLNVAAVALEGAGVVYAVAIYARKIAD
jgi:hypothetical protein